MPQKTLILASKSPRRIELLKKNGIKFKINPSDISEKTSYKSPSSVVCDLAAKKAFSVALKNPDNPVLGADTIVYIGKEILGKPKNKKDALRLLKKQNGRWQKVYTGVNLVWLNKNIFLSSYAVSKCLARKLSDEELKELSHKHHDKAGAYAVQDGDDYFIKKIVGDYDNVVGLPMKIVMKFLKIIKYK